MTEFRARRTELAEIAPLREQYRREADCQVVRDSILPRVLADPYLIEGNGVIAGYCGVWNRHFPGRILELFAIPPWRGAELPLVRAVCQVSGACELEVQSNILDGRTMLERCSSQAWVENLLFEEGGPTCLECPGVRFRPRLDADIGPEGDWVVEAEGRVIAAGGFLTHYNPPYADLYMEVVESARRRGIGSYLVQELRRVCRQQGLKPAARCDPGNHASKRTLERGGLVLCGEILAGAVS